MIRKVDIHTRITPKTRLWLEAEAKRSGLSVGEVAMRYLESYARDRGMIDVLGSKP